MHLRRQMPALGLFAVFLAGATLLLHSGLCIEGGRVIGFPWIFYTQCYGGVGPGGVQSVDPAEFLPLHLALDLVVWYLVSAGLVYVLRHTMKT